MTKGFLRGHVSWNVGKTNVYNEKTLNLMSKKRKDFYKKNPTFNRGENNSMYGRHHKDESKILLSKKLIGKNSPMKGKHLQLKTKQQVSKSLLKYYSTRDSPFKNKKHKEETIQIIKEKRSKQIFPLKDTTIEIKIQNYLKALGIEFYTHQYMKEIEHGYQCDILIPVQNNINKKIILECFGIYWHKYPFGRKIDILRCNELREAGWRVLIFWENEIRAMEKEDLKHKIIVDLKNDN